MGSGAQTSYRNSFRPALRLGATAALAICMALAFAVAPSNAHEEEPRKPIFSIVGTGHVTAEPDIAYISGGVISQAPDAEAALSDNTEKMQAVFKALEEAGIERRHIQTSNFTVEPQYTYHRPRAGEEQKPPKITGYQVRNTVTAKVEDLSKTGTILTRLVAGGSNQLGNIRFDISNREELLDQARAAAVADAKRKAEIYLTAAGVSLGKLVAISERNTGVPRPELLQARTVAADAALSAPVPVSSGTDRISVQVNMTWEIVQ